MEGRRGASPVGPPGVLRHSFADELPQARISYVGGRPTERLNSRRPSQACGGRGKARKLRRWSTSSWPNNGRKTVGPRPVMPRKNGAPKVQAEPLGNDHLHRLHFQTKSWRGSRNCGLGQFRCRAPSALSFNCGLQSHRIAGSESRPNARSHN